MLSKTDKSKLSLHISTLSENRQWLSDAVEGDWKKFPYRMVDKEGSVNKKIFEPDSQSNLFPNVPTDSPSLYLVNIPMGHSPHQKEYDSVLKLFAMFTDESFGKKTATSQKEVQKRLAIVIGINQMLSLDEKVNRQFIKWIKKMPETKTVPNRVHGFFWEPRWVECNDNKYKYPPKQAFFILKNLSKNSALLVRSHLEKIQSSSQIPFQQIRNTIKNSDHSEKFAHHFEKGAKKAPIYLAIMDDDLVSIKTDKGLFSRYDKLVQTHNTPSAMSLGYSVDEPENPIVQLGVRLDMLIRSAMTKALAFSAYFPEPNSLFCIRKEGKPHYLQKLSFLGAGNNLENRRLIQNGQSRKLFDSSAVFEYDGGVIMATPDRMYTEKNRSQTTLPPKALKKKSTLKSLRFIAQSHLFPKEWADNLYIALPLTAKQVTDVTGPAMLLFGVYDPITRMFAKTGRYSEKVFDSVIDSYDDPLDNNLTNQRNTARGQLLNQGLEKDLIDKIEEAAIKSGKAIVKEFQSLTS